MALAASILLSVAGVMWGYGHAASAGILGRTRKRSMSKNPAGNTVVLLGGRPELLAELPAIYDSPILGTVHGQRSQFISSRSARHWTCWDTMGLHSSFREEIREGLIPAHSYFFQAWVDAGILGAIFWGWVFVLTARVLLRVYPANALLLPAVSFLAFLLLWNIPFSPYGTDSRLSFSILNRDADKFYGNGAQE